MRICEFQSTLLMRGATLYRRFLCWIRSHFNPRSSCEERLRFFAIRSRIALFQSTLLMRGATCRARRERRLYQGISIHAPHARSDEIIDGANNKPREIISIHAPHARSDVIRGLQSLTLKNFNPRSSCEERLMHHADIVLQYSFQSTLLMRGATAVLGLRLQHGDISIHAPHARSDIHVSGETSPFLHFNPRSSCEERHDNPRAGGSPEEISIHAPHARSDVTRAAMIRIFGISIHAPHARSDDRRYMKYSGQ